MKDRTQRYYDKRYNRIVYVNNQATPEMWHNRWQLNIQNLTKYLSRRNKNVIKITSRFLNTTHGPVLEGGCGHGSKVKTLSEAGYTVIGVDFDRETVSFLNRHVPELDIRFGDVRFLPLADSSVAGYWSIGVIEHFYDGFERIAKEMMRVIRPSGYLFLTFPYMSPLRKVKAALNMYPIFKRCDRPSNFYQFVLDHRSVLRTFASFGFKFLYFRKDSGLKGFTEEVFSPSLLLKSYEGRSVAIKGLRFLINKSLSPFSSHSCLMVFKLIK